MRRRTTKFSRIVATLLLGTSLAAAGPAAPTCDASCKVDVRNKQWACTCRWSAPLGLACAQRTFAIPAGARMVSPATPPGTGGGPEEVIELTGGQFSVQEGQLFFTTSHGYEIGVGLERKPYVIPYRFEDPRGQVIQTGVITVAQINVKE